ncbi:MAG: hypothetical protein M2R45_03534 [Verrucomicrobia subdivision 3 bacterium]|nr:hypothetical protein [Limisphaerales bacterium]
MPLPDKDSATQATTPSAPFYSANDRSWNMVNIHKRALIRAPEVKHRPLPVKPIIYHSDSFKTGPLALRTA